jgi:hypothetical protein
MANANVAAARGAERKLPASTARQMKGIGFANIHA